MDLRAHRGHPLVRGFGPHHPFHLALAGELEKDFVDEGVETCAVDGMCQTACPVNISTGTMLKQIRCGETGRLIDAV